MAVTRCSRDHCAGRPVGGSPGAAAAPRREAGGGPGGGRVWVLLDELSAADLAHADLPRSGAVGAVRGAAGMVHAWRRLRGVGESSARVETDRFSLKRP